MPPCAFCELFVVAGMTNPHGAIQRGQAPPPRIALTVASRPRARRHPKQPATGACAGGSAPAVTRDRDAYERLLVGHLHAIDRIAASVARRHRLCRDDTEEFGAVVRMR